MSDDLGSGAAIRRDAYRKEPQHRDRGWPRGPLGDHDSGPYAPCAIGFCPRCGTNARRTTVVRGLFDCPNCTYQWHDPRVGTPNRSFDDYFSES